MCIGKAFEYQISSTIRPTSGKCLNSCDIALDGLGSMKDESRMGQPLALRFTGWMSVTPSGLVFFSDDAVAPKFGVTTDSGFARSTYST